MKSLITILNELSNNFYKKYKKDIKDIILFGSFIRGKTKPNDIDLLIIFKNKIDKEIEYEFKKIISKLQYEFSIISKTEKEIIEPSFDARESVLFEGYSILNSRFLAEEHGFKSFGLFVYSTKELSNAKKTKFYYSLKGRASNKGVIDDWKAICLSDNILLAPLDKIESAKEFFEYWGIKYRYSPLMVPERLSKRNLLEKAK